MSTVLSLEKVRRLRRAAFETGLAYARWLGFEFVRTVGGALIEGEDRMGVDWCVSASRAAVVQTMGLVAVTAGLPRLDRRDRRPRRCGQ